MGNNFEITITAADRATRVIRNINRGMSQMMRPAQQIGQSFRSIGREVSMNPLVRSMKRLGGATSTVASAMAKIYSPMAALTGIGSVAGVAALADAWGRAGLAMTYASQRIGVSAGTLASFRGAAKAAGLSADDMEGAMTSLGDTLQDALYGRNQGALALLAKLGVGIHRNANGVVDTERAMNDLADAIARIGNPQTQAVIARAFGLESMLPILRQGAEGLRKYREEAKRAGAVDEEAIEINKRFADSWDRLKLSIDGAGNSFSKTLLPSITKATDAAARWVESEHGQQAAASAGAILGNMNPLSSGFWSGNTNPLSSGFWLTRVDAMRDGYPAGSDHRQSSGRITPAGGTIGIRNNNPLNLRQWPGVPSAGGYAQFPDPTAGIRAAVLNLQSYRKLGIDTLSGVISRWAPASENDTGAYVADVAKRTGIDPGAHLDLTDRRTLAPLLSAMIRHENGANPYSPEQINAGITDALKGQKIEITVNAPPGAKVDARSSAGDSVPVRVAYSMPTTVTP